VFQNYTLSTRFVCIFNPILMIFFMLIRLFILILMILTFASFYAAATETFSIPRLAKSATIDGNIGAVEWQDAKQLPLKYITWPLRNQTAFVTTTVYIYEDGKHLFVAFDAKDPNPKNIRAFYRDRDRLDSDDRVIVEIDAFNEHRLVYGFASNTVGAQEDYIRDVLRESTNESWDEIWNVATKISDSGYTVEFKIPFKAISFKSNKEMQEWGINLVRMYPRDKQYRIQFNTINYNNNCWTCQNPHFYGMPNLKNSFKLHLTPSLTYGLTNSRDIEQNPLLDFSNQEKAELGGNLLWDITTDISLIGTINPDYSQVESDVPQIDINNNFSLSFPERRLFFLENAEYFASPSRLIYTRNLSDPEYGVKTTGRVGEHSFAAMFVKDDATNFVIPGNLNSDIATMEQQSDNAVIRYASYINESLTVGGITTLRSSQDYENNLLSVDMQWRIDKKQTLTTQFANSSSQYPQQLLADFCESGNDYNNCISGLPLDCTVAECNSSEVAIRLSQRNFEGSAYTLEYNNETTDRWLYINHRSLDAGFRADLGFIQTIDYQKSVIGGGRLWNAPNDQWWINFRISGDTDITYNQNNELIEQENEISFRINLLRQSGISLNLFERDRVGRRNDASILTIEGNVPTFNENQWSIFANSRPVLGLYAEISFGQGKRIDYSNNRLGDLNFYRTEIRWNLNRKTLLSTEYRYSQFDISNHLLYRTRITDIRLTYNFTNNSLIRVIRSQTKIEHNPDQYLYDSVSPYDFSYNTQVIYSYKLSPFSSLFVGYYDNGLTPDNMSRQTLQESNTLFVKFSYAI